MRLDQAWPGPSQNVGGHDEERNCSTPTSLVSVPREQSVKNPKNRAQGESASVDDQELRDIQAEEGGRGRKQPKKALTLERERLLRKIARLLAEPDCDEETYLETSRELGLKDESPEFQQIRALWKKRRGNG